MTEGSGTQSCSWRNVLKETILSRAMGIAPAVSVCNLYPLDVEQANHLLELAANGGNAGAHCS